MDEHTHEHMQCFVALVPSAFWFSLQMQRKQWVLQAAILLIIAANVIFFWTQKTQTSAWFYKKVGGQGKRVECA